MGSSHEFWDVVQRGISKVYAMRAVDVRRAGGRIRINGMVERVEVLEQCDSKDMKKCRVSVRPGNMRERM